MVYLGGKQKTAKYIVPILQKYIDDYGIEKYIEPFVGGANIIDKIECKDKIGADISPYLIALHNYAQHSTEYPEDITREYYNSVREQYNNHEGDDTELGIVGYLGSMNGRFFDGGYAQPLYKDGKLFRNFYHQHRDNLITQSQNSLYRNILFMCQDYEFFYGVSDCLIYCDPPYKGKKSYGTSKNFNHDKFWEWVRKMSVHNIVIVSELEAPDDFECIWHKTVSRTVKPSDGIKAVEKLFIKKS